MSVLAGLVFDAASLAAFLASLEEASEGCLPGDDGFNGRLASLLGMLGLLLLNFLEILSRRLLGQGG